MTRTKRNTKMNKKGKKPISILSPRSPSLSSYSPTPSPEPLPFKQELPTPTIPPKLPESRTISPPPELKPIPVPNLDDCPTLVVPNAYFTTEQIQRLADLNPSLRTDSLEQYGICTQINPYPLTTTCTLPTKRWSDDIDLNEPAPIGPTWKGVPNSGPGLGGSPRPTILGSPRQPVHIPNPDPEPTRDPPKTFSKVIAGTTPHTESYDTKNGERHLRCSPPPRIYPIPTTNPIPILPSEQAGIPASIADAIRILPSTDTQPAPTPVIFEPPNPVPDSRRENVRLWDGPALRHSGTFRAMVGSPDHFTRFGTEYLHNANQRNQWCFIGDAIQKLECLHRDYVDTARRTALLVASARSLGLPEAYATYVEQVKVDPFPPSRRSGITTNGIHDKTNPTPVPDTPTRKLPPAPLRNLPRGSSTRHQGSIPGVTTRIDGIHRQGTTMGSPLSNPVPTEPRAMRTQFDPNTTCLKCKRLNLPNLGHWANNCPHTICSLCKKSAPGHYKYGCPHYICTCCNVTNPGHKPTECPELPARRERAERMRRRALGYNNTRAEIEDGDYYNDPMDDMNMSCESA